MKMLKLCLQGIYLILQSLSGTFALITLIAISYLTWKVPGVGSAALVAFAGVIPAVLAIAEHREQMAQIVPPAPPNPQGPGLM
jgi:hypothetical protein